MLFMPSSVLWMWLRGLFSLVLLGSALFLLTQWYNNRETVVIERVVATPDEARVDDVNEPATARQQQKPVERIRVVPWQFGANRETAYLLGGLALLGWSIGGGWVLSPRLLRRPGTDEPRSEAAGSTQRVRLPDGTELQVYSYGPVDGDPVVCTHGWGLDRDEWFYLRKELVGPRRLIAWDLPGLGQSDRPADRDWSLDKLAGMLDAVITATSAGKPVVLLGHSIGVMITLTYCKLFPEALGPRVSGLVLAHGTYTNPVLTTSHAGIYTALQKPILEPLCHLMVWLSPLVRLLNWLSYANGSAHRSTDRDSFSGGETRGQLDFMTRYNCTAAPDVIGRGMLAMFRYDATDTLGRIDVPALVVAAEQDGICLPEASRYMAETIPGAKLVSLNPAKHCGLFEHHATFHTAVREFMASLAPAGKVPASPRPAISASRTPDSR